MFDASVHVDLKRALAGGALAAAVTLLGMWLSGYASGANVDELLRDFLPNAQAFTDTVVLASATILALMFTLLSMSTSGDSQLKKAHYVRIEQIALGDALVFVAAMTIGLLLNVPINESSKLSDEVEWIVYYSALGLSSLLGGALIAIVLMIYNAVKDMVEVLALDEKEHPLYDTDAQGSGDSQEGGDMKDVKEQAEREEAEEA
jgi:hypothetical protein